MSIPLFIRVDANYNTGNGHFMRCLALAQAWKVRNDKVTFISSCESLILRERITNEGFRYVPIKKTNPNPEDLEITLKTINNSKSNNCWVVLDGYHFDHNYQKSIKNNGNLLLVIDDIAHLEYYSADIILNQNINAENLSYSCESKTILLMGTKFVLIRDEFFDYQNRIIRTPNIAKKILITFGNNDSQNITLNVLEALIKIRIEIEISVKKIPHNFLDLGMSSADESRIRCLLNIVGIGVHRV